MAFVELNAENVKEPGNSDHPVVTAKAPKSRWHSISRNCAGNNLSVQSAASISPMIWSFIGRVAITCIVWTVFDRKLRSRMTLKNAFQSVWVRDVYHHWRYSAVVSHWIAIWWHLDGPFPGNGWNVPKSRICWYLWHQAGHQRICCRYLMWDLQIVPEET